MQFIVLDLEWNQPTSYQSPVFRKIGDSLLFEVIQIGAVKLGEDFSILDAIKARRPDAIFFANADAVRVSPRLGEAIIPVEWVHDKRTREKTRATLQAAKEAFEAERCVVMFPAGRLARIGKDGSVTDPEWAPTAASLARKYDAPVAPIHLSGPYSRLFHWFDRFSQELRDITLFHELLNKKRKPFALKVGKPIPPSRLDIDAGKATYALGQLPTKTFSNQPWYPINITTDGPLLEKHGVELIGLSLKFCRASQCQSFHI